ncbi:hypothetical protein BDV25DRAFT_138571 [Aspergillus avenaceus]|uniref:F-box domain-containing protein n=1 Tax=Aspergillus avenaceus TaxID=36643 RepID=A0A5N6U0H5_ASPAV|nr:hypothetical protein BDV25DRAFT_138571 [Aspergillus avenaceus]
MPITIPAQPIYRTTCVTTPLKALTAILNRAAPDSHTPTFSAFYSHLLHGDLLVPWSPGVVYRPIAVLTLTGDALRGGRYGRAEVYMMHPRNVATTSRCYFYVREVVRMAAKRGRLKAIWRKDGEADVSVTVTREYWAKAVLGGEGYAVRTHPSTSSNHQSNCRLLNVLPAELLFKIIDLLDFPALIYLKLTCKLFNTIIPPPTHKFLLAAERTPFASQHNLYACRYCPRLRRADKFDDKMVRRCARGSDSAEKRFCVDCGLMPSTREARYRHREFIVFQGIGWGVSLNCPTGGAGCRGDG